VLCVKEGLSAFVGEYSLWLPPIEYSFFALIFLLHLAYCSAILGIWPKVAGATPPEMTVPETAPPSPAGGLFFKYKVALLFLGTLAGFSFFMFGFMHVFNNYLFLDMLAPVLYFLFFWVASILWKFVSLPKNQIGHMRGAMAE
jgi:hypothetical protein